MRYGGETIIIKGAWRKSSRRKWNQVLRNKRQGKRQHRTCFYHGLNLFWKNQNKFEKIVKLAGDILNKQALGRAAADLK